SRRRTAVSSATTVHDETPLERARRRVGTLAQPFLLVDYRLRFDELVRQPPRADLRARAATAADLGALPPLAGTSGTATRLARGDVALLAVGEDGPVGCLWYARGPLRAPGFGFPIVAVPGECFAYGLRVDRQA